MRHRLIEKIRRVAEDARGDPRTRAIAQEKLAILKRAEPPRKAQHPGMKVAPEYAVFRYMDLGNWRRTASGNSTYTHTLADGRPIRTVLFAHKKSPTFGWLLIDLERDAQTFSQIKYATIGEAHQAAWNTLATI
jgi:hypothetical protein